MNRGIVAAVVLLCAAGCSSSNDTNNNNNGGGTGACSVTLSGAVSLTNACSAAAVWVAGNNTGAVTIAFNGTTYSFLSATSFPGEPSSKTYKSTDTGAEGGVQVMQLSNYATWVADVSSGQAPVGTYQLTLTSVSNAVSVTEGKAYTIHGSLTATLPAASGTGATGTVTVNATF